MPEFPFPKAPEKFFLDIISRIFQPPSIVEFKKITEFRGKTLVYFAVRCYNEFTNIVR